jgi:hypothetical protein
MSYAQADDAHAHGQISEFRARLSAEVQMQTGSEFPIFHDRNDIAWGQNWRTRIQEGLDAVTVLIPIITPSFFRSSRCRDEVSRFLERERRLGRQDLILPVYYISTLEMDDPTRRNADELAQVLTAREWVDWRELRFEPFTAPVVRRALAQLANRFQVGSWRELPPAPFTPHFTRELATSTAATAPLATASEPPIVKAEREAPATSSKERPPLKGVFISYRRQDEPNFAGRLYDRLSTRFGHERVFIDVDSIELGLDFTEAVRDALVKCQVLIVVIGKAWLTASDPDGRRRLENPDDFVRLEIEMASSLPGIRIIPVLVQGATAPRASELPPSLAALALKNGIEISHAGFRADTERLINSISRIIGHNRDPNR